MRIGIQIDISETFGKDHSYRYGGDEFLVIYPDATEEEFKEKLDLMMKSRPTIEINGMRSNVGFSPDTYMIYWTNRKNSEACLPLQMSACTR